MTRSLPAIPRDRNDWVFFTGALCVILVIGAITPIGGLAALALAAGLAWTRRTTPVIRWLLTGAAVVVLMGTAAGWSVSATVGTSGPGHGVPAAPQPQR